jgi:radical SAM superfamily enzyme YgiQ (UPF0313 family)
VRILLLKPQAQLATVQGLQGFTCLEPLELGYLAAVVPQQHLVKILDLRIERFPRLALQLTLQRYRPDLVGITGYSHDAAEIKRLAAQVKKKLPKAMVVVGGHHATVAPKDLNIPVIDAIVRGEGCSPFKAIVEALEQTRTLQGINDVLLPGTSWTIDGWPQFPDPATLPIPRRDLWDWRKYYCVWTAEAARPWQPLFPPTAMVRSSWGCKMKCTFCVVPHLCGGQHRPRQAQLVAEEIAALPQQHVYFGDDENFIDEAYAWELAEALSARNVHKRYFAWTRATTVNRSPKLLARWREIGLDTAFLGFEFIDDAKLRAVKKGAKVNLNEKALHQLRFLDIAVHAAFMITPDYTEEDFAALTTYINNLPPVQCSVTICTPSPGTEDYQHMQPNIWVDNPFELHDCMHPLTPTQLPLKRFAKLYADLVATGIQRTPQRLKRIPVTPPDWLRAIAADFKYTRAYRTLYRDYPATFKNK